jgi:hypothetical protein
MPRLLLGVVCVILLVIPSGCSRQAPRNSPTDNSPGDSGPITKTNFMKIRGGMTEAEVEAILGKPTYPDLNVEMSDAGWYVGDQGRFQMWRQGQNDINVLYCGHKAARWLWISDGGRDRLQKYDEAFYYRNQFAGKNPPPDSRPDPTPDPKPDPKPDPNAKVTKAFLASIMAGKTTRAEVEAVLGPPKEVGPGGRLGKSNILALKWIEGTTLLTVYVKEETGIVTGTACNLK